MPRPLKTTVDYFPHMVYDGATLFTIETQYGNDGYALWFKLLETLCRNESFTLDFNCTAKRVWFIARCHLDEERVIAILNTLADLDAIDKKLWESQRIVWVQNLINKLKPILSRREGLVIPENPLNRIAVNNNPVQCTENPPVCTNNPTINITEHNRNKQNSNSKGGVGEKEKTTTADARLIVMCDVYVKNIGEFTPLALQQIKDLSKEYSEEWFIEAVKEAVANNTRKLSYITAILKNWKAKGFKNPSPKTAKDDDPDKYIKGPYGHLIQR